MALQWDSLGMWRGKHKKNELRNVCLFVTEKKKERETIRVQLRGKSELSFTLSPFVFVDLYLWACMYRSMLELLARVRAGFISTLRCEWWFAVCVDGLMKAALLQLVEGLIHHSPVQVHNRHLLSSHLI